MKVTRQIFADLAEIILEGGAVKATKYFDEKTTVKAKRVTYQGKIDKRNCRTHIVFTIGKPNYEEQQFMKKFKKGNKLFIPKAIQIKYPNTGK